MGRWSQRLSIVSASVAAVSALGCAVTVDVAFDAREDFSRHRSWDFAPAGEPAVVAPPERQAGLEAALVGAIAKALAARGYRRAAERPDLRIHYQLSVEPRTEHVLVPRAPYLLSSYSQSPSYWIEGSETQERRYEELRLRIDVADRGGRGIWTGALRERLPAGRAADLAAAARSLLERFPLATPRPPPDPHDQLARAGVPETDLLRARLRIP